MITLFPTVKTSHSALNCPSPSNSPPPHCRRYKCAHKRQSRITYRHCTSESYSPCAVITHLSIVPLLHLSKLTSSQKLAQNSQAHSRNNENTRRETTETCQNYESPGWFTSTACDELRTFRGAVQHWVHLL